MIVLSRLSYEERIDLRVLRVDLSTGTMARRTRVREARRRLKLMVKAKHPHP
jgi:hypothetical protein